MILKRLYNVWIWTWGNLDKDQYFSYCIKTVWNIFLENIASFIKSLLAVWEINGNVWFRGCLHWCDEGFRSLWVSVIPRHTAELPLQWCDSLTPRCKSAMRVLICSVTHAQLVRQRFLKEVITLWINDSHAAAHLSVFTDQFGLWTPWYLPRFVQCHRQTDRRTASSWCRGMLYGFVMDLQNLQYYLSEEQLPHWILDERHKGIFLYIEQQRAGLILIGRERRWCFFNWDLAFLKVIQGHSLVSFILIQFLIMSKLSFFIIPTIECICFTGLSHYMFPGSYFHKC